MEGHEHGVSVEEMSFIPVEVIEAGRATHYEIFPQLDEENLRVLREEGPDASVGFAVRFPSGEGTYQREFKKGEIEGPECKTGEAIVVVRAYVAPQRLVMKS